MIDLDRVLDIVRAFNREGVEYKVFGGVAVNFHGITRTTEDVDFFVDPSPDNVAKIKRALRSIWNDPNLDEIRDDDMLGDYPSFEYHPPHEKLAMDVVSRLGEAFIYADLESQILKVDGVPVQVVTPKTLYNMKRDTVRPQDKIDAYNLRDVYDWEE